MIELPTYYGAELSFIQEDGRFYMVINEWSKHRIEISEVFYQAAVAEFSDKEQKFEKLK